MMRIPLFAVSLLLLGCGSGPLVQETPILDLAPIQEILSPRRPTGGMAEEIRALVEKGDSVSLPRAIEYINSRDLEETEFGRMMIALAVTLLQKLYPGAQSQTPKPDPPQTHGYTRILREAERENYTSPPENSQDYLELTLPFLALLNENQPGRLLSSLPDLEKARGINPQGVLAPYFMGLVYERTGNLDQAEASYRVTSQLSGDCYPAILGLARLLILRDNREESVRLLSDLVIRYPDNMIIKRQLALGYYHIGDWSRAEPAIAEVLQRNNRDSEFILMRARVLVEQGQFLQAQAPLDLYGTMDPDNRLYLFLRARVQAEGYSNRDAALNYLRAILRKSPEDDEVSLYAAGLLLESNRTEDQAEGRELLRRRLQDTEPSRRVINLALLDAIRRESWEEARSYAEQSLAQGRDVQVLLLAYQVEQGLGNHAAALALAEELYRLAPGNEETVSGYVSALIDNGQRAEAGRIIESRIASLPGGALKSRYYYLRSRLKTGEDAAMADLRASLFEDPRNLSALVAMFEIYRRHEDDRRAVYYLKQALALDPDNPQLKRWETEYAALLGTTR